MQARLELVNAIGLVYTSLGSLLEVQHMQDLYLWLERLVKNPMSAEDAPLVPGTAAHIACQVLLAAGYEVLLLAAGYAAFLLVRTATP